MISSKISTLKEFRNIFILKFTQELINHSRTGEIIQLENIVKEEDEKEKKEIKEQKKRIKEIVKKEIILSSKEKLFPPKLPPIAPKKIIKRPARPLVLRIPETRLPPHLSYLKPSPTPNVEIDLEKLNPLIKDPAVVTIEAVPEEKIIVTGRMGRKPTNIILNKEEINKIIKKFSEKSKIPIHEGIFRVVAGKLILSAIISEVVGSKFIIKKMMYVPRLR